MQTFNSWLLLLLPGITCISGYNRSLLQSSASKAEVPSACDRASQRSALLSFFNLTEGPFWTNQLGWNTYSHSTTTQEANNMSSSPKLPPLINCTTSLAKTLYASSNTQISSSASSNFEELLMSNTYYTAGVSATALPDYCCWHGVYCCLQQQNDTDNICSRIYRIPASSPLCNCTVGLVTSLSLGGNNVTGALSTAVMDRFCPAFGCSLINLDLHHNQMSGSLPSQKLLSSLSVLQSLDLSLNSFSGTFPDAILQDTPSLSYLSLSYNALTGTIPMSLCQPGAISGPLVDLRVAGNQLSGTLNLSACRNLVYLDVANNSLSGLVNYNSPSLDSGGYNRLQSLLLASNNITFGSSSATARVLGRRVTDLDLSNNAMVSGPLLDLILSMVALKSLNLQNTNVSGTVPIQLFELASLETVRLANLRLTGSLPANLKALKSLTYLDISNNSLTGTIPKGMTTMAGSNMYLNLRDNYLSCCGTNFSSPSSTTTAVIYGYSSFNFSSAPLLPDGLAFSKQLRTVLEPRAGRMLTPRVLGSAAQQVGPTFVNMSYFGLRCPFLKLSKSPDEPAYWLNWDLDPAYYLFEGCSCDQGYVLTVDLYSYSMPVGTCFQINTNASMQWFSTNPWIYVLLTLFPATLVFCLAWYMCLLRRGGSPHNMLQSIMDMRKGMRPSPVSGLMTMVVTDIQGFTELMQSTPTEQMVSVLMTHNNIIQKARSANFGHIVEQEGDSYSIVFEDAVDAVKFCLQAQQMLARQRWPKGVLKDPQVDKASIISAALSDRLKSLVATDSSRGGDNKHSLMATNSNSLMATNSNSLMATNSNRLVSANSSLNNNERFSVLKRMSTTAVDVVVQNIKQVHQTLQQQQPNHLSGLLVRMGIATGRVPPGKGLSTSLVMEVAKCISDAAHGGQTLLSSATFKAVRSLTVELGCVTEEGLDLSLLDKPSLWWWLRGCARGSVQKGQDAILLDMGQYMYCPRGFELPLVLKPESLFPERHLILDAVAEEEAASSSSDTGSSSGRRNAVQPDLESSSHSVGSIRSITTPGSLMRYYQVLPPKLSSRAYVFGDNLNLKRSWERLQESYFSAPGASCAPLSSYDAFHLRNAGPLPAVTCVFCMVEGGKQYSTRHPSDAVETSQILLTVMRTLLRQIGGGYLVKQSEGDFKYMLTFMYPEEALYWCTALQLSIMYEEWPTSCLMTWPTQFNKDDQLLFRGPRLKTGVYEGGPTSISPDHMGRADFHGKCINMSARLMDAAAHGGQVVCEESTAKTVMSRWSQVLRESGVAVSNPEAEDIGILSFQQESSTRQPLSRSRSSLIPISESRSSPLFSDEDVRNHLPRPVCEGQEHVDLEMHIAKSTPVSSSEKRLDPASSTLDYTASRDHTTTTTTVPNIREEVMFSEDVTYMADDNDSKILDLLEPPKLLKKCNDQGNPSHPATANREASLRRGREKDIVQQAAESVTTLQRRKLDSKELPSSLIAGQFSEDLSDKEPPPHKIIATEQNFSSAFATASNSSGGLTVHGISSTTGSRHRIWAGRSKYSDPATSSQELKLSQLSEAAASSAAMAVSLNSRSAPASFKAVWRPNDDSVLPEQWLDMHASLIGTYRLKGSDKEMRVVNVLPGTLLQRRYPSHAPANGKGSRVAELQGVVASSYIPMLKAVDAYCESYNGELEVEEPGGVPDATGSALRLFVHPLFAIKDRFMGSSAEGIASSVVSRVSQPGSSMKSFKMSFNKISSTPGDGGAAGSKSMAFRRSSKMIGSMKTGTTGTSSMKVKPRPFQHPAAHVCGQNAPQPADKSQTEAPMNSASTTAFVAPTDKHKKEGSLRSISLGSSQFKKISYMDI